MKSIKRLTKRISLLRRRSSSQKEDLIPNLQLADPRAVWILEEAEPTEEDCPCKVHLLTGELGFLTKYYGPEQEDLKPFFAEVNALKTLGHANLHKTLAAFYWESYLWVIRDRSLHSYDLISVMAAQGPLTELQLTYVALCTCRALQHLHANLIVHRNINSSNITVAANGSVKLGGLSSSAQLQSLDDQLTQREGAVYWMAPEMALAHDRMTSYGHKADIWSLGITVLELAEGEPPHFSTPPRRVFSKITKLPPPTLLYPHKFSRQLSELLSQCLAVDPAQRPETTQLLEHPFFLDSSGTAADVSGLVLDYERAQGVQGVQKGVTEVQERAQEPARRNTVSPRNSTVQEDSESTSGEPRKERQPSPTAPSLPTAFKFHESRASLTEGLPQKLHSGQLEFPLISTPGLYKVNMDDKYESNQSKKKLQRLHGNMPNKSNTWRPQTDSSTSSGQTQLNSLRETDTKELDMTPSIKTVEVSVVDIIPSVRKKPEDSVAFDQGNSLADNLKKTVTFSPSTKSAVSDCFPNEHSGRWIRSNDDDPFAVFCPETDEASLFITSKPNSKESSSQSRPGAEDQITGLPNSDSTFPTPSLDVKILPSPLLTQIETPHILSPFVLSNGTSFPSLKTEDLSKAAEGSTAGITHLDTPGRDLTTHPEDTATAHLDTRLDSNAFEQSPRIKTSSNSLENRDSHSYSKSLLSYETLPSIAETSAPPEETSKNPSNKFAKGRRLAAKK